MCIINSGDAKKPGSGHYSAHRFAAPALPYYRTSCTYLKAFQLHTKAGMVKSNNLEAGFFGTTPHPGRIAPENHSVK